MFCQNDENRLSVCVIVCVCANCAFLSCMGRVHLLCEGNGWVTESAYKSVLDVPDTSHPDCSSILL